MDGLEPLLSDKMLPIMVEAEVSRLVPKPRGNGGYTLALGLIGNSKLWDSVDLTVPSTDRDRQHLAASGLNH